MLPRILLAGDDPRALHFLATLLAGQASLCVATNGAAALRMASEAPPDLVLLDTQVSGMNGIEVCRALKRTSELEHIPVMFVTADTSEEFEMAGFHAGAADFVRKPVNPRLVRVRVQHQLRFKAMGDLLRKSASTDGLTGLANRATFDRTLEREWARAERTRNPLSLLIVDVDHFKLYNDRYGHPAGDQCLRRVADALQRVCRRPADLAARLGGEEFALILPETPEVGAARVAESLLLEIDALGIAHAASTTRPTVSVSVGIATHDARESGIFRTASEPEGGSSERALELVQSADHALYQAKHSGRARACSSFGEVFQAQASLAV
ncbi:MAG: diguanylate cyclase [Polyangiaceae bacterium]|nr:diguanylate cyclase [Polyangiaceae bacterium]MCB9608859.1 diguanylate cyclase [Polyangiaceae bacterium]